MMERYDNFHPEFVIPFVYIVITCLFVAQNLFFGVGRYSINSRLRFGYVLMTLSLVSFVLIEEGVVGGSFSRTTGFWLLLLSVVVLAVGGGVQQSSFYRFAALLPASYTHALMFGESCAGVFVSFNRIWTKLSYDETPDGTRDSTFLFVYMSITYAACPAPPARLPCM